MDDDFKFETFCKSAEELTKFIQKYPFSEVEDHFHVKEWIEQFKIRSVVDCEFGSAGNFESLMYLMSGLFDFKFFILGRIRYLRATEGKSFSQLLDQREFITKLVQPLVELEYFETSEHNLMLRTVKYSALFEKDCCNRYGLEFLSGSMGDKTQFLLCMSESIRIQSKPRFGKRLDPAGTNSYTGVVNNCLRIAKEIKLEGYEFLMCMLCLFPATQEFMEGHLSSIAASKGVSVPEIITEELEIVRTKYLAVFELYLKYLTSQIQVEHFEELLGHRKI